MTESFLLQVLGRDPFGLFPPQASTRTRTEQQRVTAHPSNVPVTGDPSLAPTWVATCIIVAP